MASIKVYVLRDPRTEEIRYVGITLQSLGARLRGHLTDTRSNNPRTCWIKSLKKLGLAPTIQLLQLVPSDSWEEAEKYWIRYFRSIGCQLTNTSDGGQGSLTTEQRQKIASARRGRSMSPDHKAKLLAANKGRHVSEETRAAQSRARTGSKRSPETLERMRIAHTGITHTEETKRKISEAKKGKKMSDEARANMSRGRLGVKMSEEARRKSSETQKGKTIPEETRAKLRDAWTRRAPVSEETKARHRAYVFTDEHRASLCAARKRLDEQKRLVKEERLEFDEQ